MKAVGERLCYLAEWYLPDLTAQTVDELVARIEAGAVALTGGGSRVRLLVTLAVPSDEVLYGVFGADSPEAVSRLCHHIGAPPQRLSVDIGARIRPFPS